MNTLLTITLVPVLKEIHRFRKFVLDFEMPKTLGVFPLPSAVLLPSSILPLHIFERRYRQLIEDALASNGMLAITKLADDHLENPDPSHSNSMGLAQILSHKRLKDGRYHVLLRGVARVRKLCDVDSEKLYKMAKLELVRDDVSEFADSKLSILHEQLIAICDRLSYALNGGGSEIREMVRQETEPGRCADIIAGALVADADKRQAILETTDPGMRLDVVFDHVSQLLVDLSPRSEFPN